MNNEIKKRIESINNGTAPVGYKKTKVGIVPEEWEEKKGTDLFSYIRNGFVGTVSPYYVPNGHTYIQGNNIKDGKIIPDNMMYVNDEFQLSHQNSILHIGDIIVIQSGDAGKNAVVTAKYENANCHALIIMTPYSETNTMYISYLLNSPLGMNMIKGFITGNVLHHILASDYKKLRYILPPLPEQQKIAEILTAQDAVIALMQKQIELLQKQKKAFLQKMFPKKGSNVPEIRFAGFTDDWEQRKVGETYNVTRGYVLAAPKTSPIKTDEMPYPVYSSQTKDEGLMGYYNEYLYENAITWTTDGANAGTVNYRAGKFYCTNVCGVLLSDKGYANKAAAEALNMIAWKWVSHVGNPKLMNNVMAEIEISLPPTLQEQDKISEFLESLDSLITLHQRKLEIEQQKKKALMQLLLTGKVRVKT